MLQNPHMFQNSGHTCSPALKVICKTLVLGNKKKHHTEDSNVTFTISQTTILILFWQINFKAILNAYFKSLAAVSFFFPPFLASLKVSRKDPLNASFPSPAITKKVLLLILPGNLPEAGYSHPFRSQIYILLGSPC